MKETIIKKLREIEKENNIKILWAVESGSRAWNMESKNSDYDVRFVYKRQPKEYLKITEPVDIITAHYDKDGNISEAKGCYIDIIGFDVLKFTRMLIKSNPTCIEWLKSDIRYIGYQNANFYHFAANHFNPCALYHHYRSMAEQNYLKYIKSNEQVTYKKYLYALRGILSARYVRLSNSLPPMDFPLLLTNLMEREPEDLGTTITSIFNLIALKKSGREQDIEQNNSRFDSFIELELKKRDKAPVPRLPSKESINDLNEELYNILFTK